MADPHPHLVPKVLEKSRAIPLLTLRACVAYKKGENRLICTFESYLFEMILFCGSVVLVVGPDTARSIKASI